MLISNAYRISALFWILSSSSTKFNFQYYFCTYYVQVISSRIYFHFYFDKIFGTKPFEYFNFFPYSALDQNLCAVLITHHPQQNLWIVLKSLLELFPFVNLGVWLFRKPKRENRKKQTILGKKRQTFFYVLWIEFVEPARDYERAIWDIFHRLIFHLMHAKYQLRKSIYFETWACASPQPASQPVSQQCFTIYELK